MSVLDGFRMEQSSRTQAHPMMTIMRPGVILFSKTTLDVLGYPSHVQCFYNDEGGEFAIRPCKETDEGSTRFYRGGINDKTRARWSNLDVANYLRDYAGDRIGENENFRVTGLYYKEDNAVVFNLHNAVQTKRLRKVSS